MSQRKDSGTGAICPSTSLSNCVTLPQLVAELYGEAAAAERCRILEHLMQPLGVLSLAVVANGIFAKIWFRSGWHGLQVRPEDVAIVQPGDVFELARHTEQVSTEAWRRSRSCSPHPLWSQCHQLVPTSPRRF